MFSNNYQHDCVKIQCINIGDQAKLEDTRKNMTKRSATDREMLFGTTEKEVPTILSARSDQHQYVVDSSGR